MEAELVQTLTLLEGLANKAKILASHNISGIEGNDNYGDLQKAIVGIIRGSEFAFEELTGVKYTYPAGTKTEDTIPN
jgi:hypothetical protein